MAEPECSLPNIFMWLYKNMLNIHSRASNNKYNERINYLFSPNYIYKVTYTLKWGYDLLLLDLIKYWFTCRNQCVANIPSELRAHWGKCSDVQ